MESFGIQIEDGSELLPKYVVDTNSTSVQLYDWQRRAMKCFFESNGRVLFEIVTGGGKTFCTIEIMKKLLEKNPELYTLIVVPKNVILEKTWYKELYDAGFSLKDIGVFYGSIKEYGKITITNMQSIEGVNLDIFDLVVWDEIHNFCTPRMMEYLNHDFKYMIGLSATIKRIDNAHKELLEIFNYNHFKYSPEDALDDEVLNPFNFINVGIVMDEQTNEKYLDLTQKINLILQAGGGFFKIMKSGSGLKYKMLSKLNERKDLVNNYKKKFAVMALLCMQHKKDKIIIFNEYNKQTSKAYWYLLDTNVRACVVHSGIPNDRREQNLIDFKNDKYNVVLTSKVLDEGYNLPKLDVAIIAAGNSTTKQTIQRMGRVLRKKKKRSMLYQLYCKNTIEEDYAVIRAKLFKGLCSNYNQYTYDREMVLDE